MTEPPAMRPPAGAEDGSYHWARDDAGGTPKLMRWENGLWWGFGWPRGLSPEETFKNCWSYLAPCEPPPDAADAKVFLAHLRGIEARHSLILAPYTRINLPEGISRFGVWLMRLAGETP